MKGYDMKKTMYIYPGTFSPPTYGHLDLVRRAVEAVGELTIICSCNPNKPSNWFAPEEAVELWLSYDLDYSKVRVVTLEQFALEAHDLGQVVVVRGIRDADDLVQEGKVMELNQEKYRIDKYFYLLAQPQYQNISSTAARDLASEQDCNYESMLDLVSPQVAGALITRYQGLKKKGTKHEY